MLRISLFSSRFATPDLFTFVHRHGGVCGCSFASCRSPMIHETAGLCCLGATKQLREGWQTVCLDAEFVWPPATCCRVPSKHTPARVRRVLSKKKKQRTLPMPLHVVLTSSHHGGADEWPLLVKNTTNSQVGATSELPSSTDRLVPLAFESPSRRWSHAAEDVGRFSRLKGTGWRRRHAMPLTSHQNPHRGSVGSASCTILATRR